MTNPANTISMTQVAAMRAALDRLAPKPKTQFTSREAITAMAQEIRRARDELGYSLEDLATLLVGSFTGHARELTVQDTAYIAHLVRGGLFGSLLATFAAWRMGLSLPLIVLAYLVGGLVGVMVSAGLRYRRQVLVMTRIRARARPPASVSEPSPTTRSPSTPAGTTPSLPKNCKVAEQLRPRWPKLADLMDSSEHDVLAYMSFPRQHRTKLHSTNPIERLNKEVKRRADVVGIFPNEASIMRLIGAVLFEQNDEWLTASRYMMVEAFAQIDKEEIDPILSITTKAA